MCVWVMRGWVGKKMAGAEEELERRSKFLKGLIQKKKDIEQQEQHDHLQHSNLRVRACDMPLPLQNCAFRCARDLLDSMSPKKLDSKRLALALKKVTFLFNYCLCSFQVSCFLYKICFWFWSFATYMVWNLNG